ncbi:MAG: EndoU domain-containing protein [Bacteroidetes bacterium]|nr:EndoU domain-containing protein [Bacteroidota bacterium]
MSIEFYYYIHEKAEKKGENDLPPGPRIYRTTRQFIFTNDDNTLHGPYKSLRGLRKSPYFQWLQKHDPKRAIKMCKDEHILVVKDFIRTSSTFSTEETFIKAIEHIIKGSTSNGKVSGVHYYDQSRVRITKKLKQGKNGVWSAYIELFNDNTNKWVRKNKASTFFPIDWSLTKVFHECYYANQSKKKIKNSKFIYTSITPADIKVVIVMRDAKIISIYPIIEKSECNFLLFFNKLRAFLLKHIWK